MITNEFKDKPFLDKDQSVQERDFALETRLYKNLFEKVVDSYKQEILRLDQLKGEFIREDYYHEVHSKHHIMYKYRCDDKGNTHLMSSDGHRGYEFLIEFDTYNPGYGIYFGCRGLIFKGNQKEEILKFAAEWNEIKETVRLVLDNTFENIIFIMARFLPTNNANNKTYWPFWIQLQPGEDIIGVGALAVKLIFMAYKEYLSKGTTITVRKKKDPDYSKTRYTEAAYKNLLKKIRDPEKAKKMEYFLERAVQEDISLLKRDIHYEKAWRVYCPPNIDPDLRSNDAISFILSMVCNNIGLTPNSEKRKDNTPWSIFDPIILSIDGYPLRNIRQQNYRFKKKDMDGEEHLLERKEMLTNYAEVLVDNIFNE